MNRSLLILALVVGISLVGAPGAWAQIVQDFSGPPAGTIVGPGTFPDFTVTGTNTGGGPDLVIIYDSSNPTGEDPDLGSPNETCPGGGPGIGVGGEVGQPGENCTPRGNLLVIAEDDVDVAPADGLIDDPDDEAGGGRILFHFDEPVQPLTITIMDIDNESAAVSVTGDTLNVVVNATDLGNNSAQTLDISGEGSAQCILVTFSSSGAVADLTYARTVAVEPQTWGNVKNQYR